MNNSSLHSADRLTHLKIVVVSLVAAIVVVGVGIAARPTVPLHVYPAGHGFSCDERASFHEPSHRLARERTIAFFRSHVG